MPTTTDRRLSRLGYRLLMVFLTMAIALISMLAIPDAFTGDLPWWFVVALATVLVGTVGVVVVFSIYHRNLVQHDQPAPSWGLVLGIALSVVLAGLGLPELLLRFGAPPAAAGPVTFGLAALWLLYLEFGGWKRQLVRDADRSAPAAER